MYNRSHACMYNVCHVHSKIYLSVCWIQNHTISQLCLVPYHVVADILIESKNYGLAKEMILRMDRSEKLVEMVYLLKAAKAYKEAAKLAHQGGYPQMVREIYFQAMELDDDKLVEAISLYM